MFKSKWLCFLLVMVFVPVIWGGQISPFLEDYLQGFTTSDDVKVLVMFEEQADIQSLNLQLKQERATIGERNRRVVEALQDVASRTQPAMVAYFDQLRAQGLVSDYQTLWLANMAIVEATKAGVYAMADHQDIDEIFLSYEIEGIKPTEVSDETGQPVIASHEVGLDRINAPAAWAAGFTGAGAVVANMDTGVDGNHPALAARFRGDVDDDGDVDESWYDPYTTNWPYPQDSGSHGTHTLGTICGRSATDTIGVAIDAQWISAAPIDRGGGIPRTVADAILSFQWFADPDDNPSTQDNPDAVGNSWGVTTGHGYPPCDDTFWAVIDNLEAAGTAVVFSAGNEGPSSNSLRRPADRATTQYNVFSVGAVDGASPSLPIASFSSRGPSYCTPDGQPTFKPEVVAPGVNVRSSVPGGGYTTMSGTSMASPHVTGAIGVIRGVNPDLDVDSIKEILMATANDLGPQGEDNDFGVGVIDLYEACLVAMQGYGFIDGHVYDADNDPIGDALITIDGTTRRTRADGTGYYSIGLPADTTYSVTASYFGYVSQSADVNVVPDVTTTQDFILAAAAYGVLHGYVTDLSSNPIANASIHVVDTPLDPVLTDNNGHYIMDNIPGGATYTIEVAATGYGYASGDIFVPVQDTVQLDFSLQEMESFEGSNGGWLGEGVWEWGAPSSGPGGAYDGNNVWATVLGGQYPNNADDGLYTAFYLVNDPNAVLSFYHWYNMENNWDGGNIHVSTDGGNSWVLVTPTSGYPNPDVVGLDNEPGFSDQTSGWEQVIVELDGYDGQTIMIKFRFGSDGSVTRDGWYIDGVVLNGGTIVAPEANVSETSFYVELPTGGNVTHSMTISNTGDATLSYDITVLTDAVAAGNTGRPVIDDSFPSSKDGYFVTESGEIKFESEPQTSGGVITRVGGPDGFGYTFIDSDEDGGPAYDWIDISGVGTPVTFNGYNPADDGYSDPFPMGMSFEFYGVAYTDVMVSTNGWVSFDVYTTSYLSNSTIPNTSNPNSLIAVEWDDLDGGTPGICYYYYDEDENRFIVSWVDWAYYPDASTPVHSFQVILDGDDNSIVMQYGDIAGAYQSDITIGIENQAGDVGLLYSYNDFAPFTGLAIRFNYPLFWLTVDPMSGFVDPGQSADLDVTFDAAELVDGLYFGEIRIQTNDPDNSMFAIPCTLNVGPVGVEDEPELPSVFALNQNYPNPFNPRTGISFGVPVSGRVTLEVYDIMGRSVTTLVDEELSAGRHEVIWDGLNAAGEPVTSGVYFYKLNQGDNTTTKKMIMLK